MTSYFKRLVLLIVTLTLIAATPGCTISKKECLQGDWQTKGYTDGVAGKSPDVITRYAEKCAKHGVTPDPSAYTVGFEVGIALYCTAENGFSEGQADESYSGACPAELEDEFLKNYVTGLRLTLDKLSIDYDLQRIELDTLRDRRDRLEVTGASTSKYDKRIKYQSQLLRSNTDSRSSLIQKIGKWSTKL